MTLLPCPFCGGSAFPDRFPRPHRDEVLHAVVCYSCACEGPWSPFEGEAERLWNQRQPGQPDPDARSQGAADALRDVSGWLDAAGVPPAPRGLHGSVEQVQARIAGLREAAEIVRGGGGG